MDEILKQCKEQYPDELKIKYVAQHKNYQVADHDLFRLEKGNWLNTALINFYFSFLEGMYNFLKCPHNNLLMDTIAYTFLGKQEYSKEVCASEALMELTKLQTKDSAASIFDEKNRIFWVVNSNNSHWYLIETSKAKQQVN